MADEGSEHDLGRFQHPRFARAFIDVAEQMDRRGAGEHRRRLLAGLSGAVLEVGAGHGRNFPLYPPQVTRVLAVEPDDTLRAAARRAALVAPVPVEVVAGHAQALPADSSSTDAVVFSLVLCSVPDPAGAVREACRVLRPGGELRYYEHVRSAGVLLGLLQDAVTPLWSLAAGGCRPNRRTSQTLRSAGLVIVAEERFGFRPVPGAPSTAHVLGVARVPGGRSA